MAHMVTRILPLPRQACTPHRRSFNSIYVIWSATRSAHLAHSEVARLQPTLRSLRMTSPVKQHDETMWHHRIAGVPPGCRPTSGTGYSTSNASGTTSPVDRLGMCRSSVTNSCGRSTHVTGTRDSAPVVMQSRSGSHGSSGAAP